MYLPFLRCLRFGSPVMVERENDPLRKLDFGRLINSKKVEEMRVLYVDALSKGAISLFEGNVQESMIFPGQDVQPSVAPRPRLNIPRNSNPYPSKPFDPLTTSRAVFSLAQLISG